MKKLFYLILILILVIVLVSCAGRKKEYFDKETITAVCYITDVHKAKYSKVQGYIYYKGIKLDVDNGNTGYHYKDYNLHSGDVITITVTVYMESHYTSSPYKNDVLLSTSDINVSRFEKFKY